MYNFMNIKRRPTFNFKTRPDELCDRRELYGSPLLQPVVAEGIRPIRLTRDSPCSHWLYGRNPLQRASLFVVNFSGEKSFIAGKGR